MLGGNNPYITHPSSAVNLYTIANAVSMPDYEANDASTGFTFTNAGNVTITAETVTVNSSTYSLKIENTSGVPDTGSFSVFVTLTGLVSGHTYQISCDFYRPTGSSGNWNYKTTTGAGWTTGDNDNLGTFSLDTWFTRDLIDIATGTSHVVEFNARSGNDDGDILYADNFRVIDLGVL